MPHPTDIVRSLAHICRRYHIADLYVFGSRAAQIKTLIHGRESAPEPSTAASDVDIGVLPAERTEWSAQKRVRLTMELEDLFRVNRVDLVLLPEAEAYLALDIIRGELLYTSDPDNQARYELFVLRRAGDLLPYKRERNRMILEEGAR